ncbi:MAG: SUMF1/EgtB/PvdO family nonheme iron enzyme [Nitrospiraceae bacterium]|nr:SUMF1/EgtB/PvdO family nonheme iron enzyme [Nitrospiraceae bacterium]
MEKMHVLSAMWTVAVLAVCAAASMAQIPEDFPEFVKEEVRKGMMSGSGNSMMVTNSDFAQFRPSFEYVRGQELHPALVSENDARDYATWIGLKLGEALLFRRMPRSERGVIMRANPGVDTLESGATVEAPTAPEGMVYVPEGVFTMGSTVGDPDETPQHKANAGPFFIDKYEVSNAEFQAEFPEFTFKAGRENCAAIVTWFQAAEYAERVGKRLPTEREWEKAARGTDGRTFPWGESHDPSFTNWDESDPRGAAPARPESPYGCVDMAGGAWEWTADWYQPYPGNLAPSDQYGELYKVIRGGASFNDVAMTRTTHRYYLPPETTGHLHVGFRCVRDL